MCFSGNKDVKIHLLFILSLQVKSFLDRQSRLNLPRKEYPKEALVEEVVEDEEV